MALWGWSLLLAPWCWLLLVPFPLPPPTVVTEDQLGAAVCLALLKGPGLCCGHNRELLGMLGIRPHLVVSHHGRKGLVSLVYYKAWYIIINVILL